MKFIQAHLLPSERLVTNDGKVIPLNDDDFLNTVYNSFKAWLKKAGPNGVPVLKEHTPDGGNYGSLKDVYMKPSGIYGKLEVEDEIYDGIQSGKFKHVSPSISWRFKDNTGMKFPAVPNEISVVSVPRFLIGQEPLGELNGGTADMFSQTSVSTEKIIDILTKMKLTNFGEVSTNDSQTTSATIVNAELTTGVLEMNIDELKTLITETVSEVVDQKLAEHMELMKKEEVKEEVTEEVAVEAPADAVEVKAEETDMAATVEPEKAVEDAPAAVGDDKDAEIAKLKAELEALKAKDSEVTKMSQIHTDISNKEVKDEKVVEKLSKLFDADKDLYEFTLGLIPDKTDFSHNHLAGLSLSRGKKTAPSRDEIAKRALEIQFASQRSGKPLSYGECITLAEKE